MTHTHPEGFDYTIIRSSRRKSMALVIKQGEVIVRIPTTLAVKTAQDFVDKKRAWIKQKLEQLPVIRETVYADGESFLFLGNTYQLDIHTSSAENTIKHIDNRIQLYTKKKDISAEGIKRQLEKWYRQQANELLTSRFFQLAEAYQFFPKSLTIKTYKARWGSCYRSGDIQLNWKLIMATDKVIDYVILHELCHLRHHNHSKAFWQLVADICPTYKEHKLWLKQNGDRLTL
ncbi:M48 family metallopeptidase [Methylophaga sp.]|uniref:M48 family metallopeptidase n=1 Tax=Methylophaga sp. TaxID=2024840 RepID=UPI003A905959